jgi:hypothetical protein
VCVPLDPAAVDSFQLAQVPRLAAIMGQLDAGVPTDMDAAVADFRRLFLEPLDAALRRERTAAKQHQLDF